ncbi:MAG: LysM peptidoglycan-binding domain-containing protein [Clostridia bacterium]|nr:LysM peptidoglycan-binding domain-containing protein [Clostridia bacterium]
MNNKGFFYYEIKQGDTIYKLTKEFETSVDRIICANPNINIYNLKIGNKIIIPVGNIVDNSEYYNSEKIKNDLNNLLIIYPFLEIKSIGKSELGKEIYCIKIGNGNKKIFYNGSFHANELITTNILMQYIEQYSRAFVENKKIYNYNAKELFYDTSLYIIPLVNPDGVDLVTGSLLDVDSAYQNAKNIADNFPNIPFPQGWKANINGVDLNLQFPAEWEKAKEIKYAQGFDKPAPRDFVGYGPLTAKESKAIYEFTLKHNFSLVISYHTQGQVIYWDFQNINPPNGKQIGERFSEVSGYKFADVPYNSSFAGYKDWFILKYNKPGYTIEAGLGNNPIPIEQFYKIYEENIGILTLGLVL